MRSDIERVIAELEEASKKCMEAYVGTGDEWYRGVSFGYQQSCLKLKEVLNGETSDPRNPPEPE